MKSSSGSTVCRERAVLRVSLIKPNFLASNRSRQCFLVGLKEADA